MDDEETPPTTQTHQSPTPTLPPSSPPPSHPLPPSSPPPSHPPSPSSTPPSSPPPSHPPPPSSPPPSHPPSSSSTSPSSPPPSHPPPPSSPPPSHAPSPSSPPPSHPPSPSLTPPTSPSQCLSTTLPQSSTQPPPSQPLSSSSSPSPTPPQPQSQSSTPPCTPPPSRPLSSSSTPSSTPPPQLPSSTPPPSHAPSSTSSEQEIQIIPEQQQSPTSHHVGAPTSITPPTTIMQNQEQPQHQAFRRRAQIFIIAIILQLLFAFMNLFAKLAMDEGMSNFVFVAYRNIVAFMVITPFAVYFEWNQLPNMTKGIFFRILMLSLLGLADQDLYFLGMKFTTATYATAMSNLLPVITFVLAWIRGTEYINRRLRRDQAKVIGTLVIVLGATVMTMVKGFKLFGTVGAINHGHHDSSHTIIGLMVILIGCICSAFASILQTIITDEYHYPALSLVSLVIFFGSVEAVLVAWIVEARSHYTIWTVFRWDVTLLSAIYAGIFCSGLGYYLRVVVTQARGVVYASSFGPLCMIFVSILDIFILGEPLLLGRLIGAVVICAGFGLAMWGRARDVTRTSQDAQEESHPTTEATPITV